MKKLILLSLAFFGFVASSTQVAAQTTLAEETQNYFVLTRNVQQLKPIILAAADLAETDGEQFGEFHVVICGQAVKDLTNAELMEPYLQLAKANHVKLIACGFSLRKFEVNEGTLPEQMEVVQNGILYGFTLEKAGYHAITL